MYLLTYNDYVGEIWNLSFKNNNEIRFQTYLKIITKRTVTRRLRPRSTPYPVRVFPCGIASSRAASLSLTARDTGTRRRGRHHQRRRRDSNPTYVYNRGTRMVRGEGGDVASRFMRTRTGCEEESKYQTRGAAAETRGRAAEKHDTVREARGR